MPSYANSFPTNGINDLNRPEISFGFPIGTVLAFSAPQGTALPAGWVLCDGAPYLQTTYPELFNAVGTVFGDGTRNANGTVSGISGLNVPDHRAVFHRGPPGGGGATDPGARTAQNVGGSASGVGSFESHAFQGHWHVLYATVQGNGGYDTLPCSSAYNTPIGAANGGSQGRTILTGSNGTVHVGKETRPDNVATLFMIRASSTI